MKTVPMRTARAKPRPAPPPPPPGQALGIDVSRKDVVDAIGRLVRATLRSPATQRYVAAARRAGRRGRHIDVEDLTQDVLLLVHRRNSTKSAFDPSRSAFSRYVTLCVWNTLTHQAEGRDLEALVDDPAGFANVAAAALDEPPLPPEIEALGAKHERELKSLARSRARDAATGQGRLFALEDELPDEIRNAAKRAA